MPSPAMILASTCLRKELVCDGLEVEWDFGESVAEGGDYLRDCCVDS